MKRLSINDDIKYQQKRPHSTNDRTRGGKRMSFIQSYQNSNQKVLSSHEINDGDDQKKINNQKNIQYQQRNSWTQDFKYNSKNNNNNLSINSQGQIDQNIISFDKGQLHPQFKALILQQESFKIGDGESNTIQNSSNFIYKQIDPIEIMYTDLSICDEIQSQMKHMKNIVTIQQNQEQKSKMAQSNAFHTKLKHKKQNQKQILMNCINIEEKQQSFKQIEMAKLIQQLHFQNNLFFCSNQRFENSKNDNEQKNPKCEKSQDKLNISNFNKNFYNKLNNNKQTRNRSNSLESIKNDLKKENQLNVSNKSNCIEIKQDQYFHKSNCNGKKHSFVSKETLNLILQKLSQSKYNQIQQQSSSLNQTLDTESNSRLMNTSILATSQIKASQTFYNRRHSLQNNKSLINQINPSSDKKQPFVKGKSINRFYKKNTSDNILNKSLNTDISLNKYVPNHVGYNQEDLTQRDQHNFINQINDQSEREKDQLQANHNILQKNTNNIQNRIQDNNFIQEQNNDQIKFLITNSIQYQKNQEQQPNNKRLSFSQRQQVDIQNNSQNILRNDFYSQNEVQSNNQLQIQMNSKINQRKSINYEQNVLDKNSIILKQFQENDKKSKEQNFIQQHQSQRSKEGNEKKKSQSSFNFYSQNSQSKSSNTQNFNKCSKSQLVSHNNHIERKLSNMSQDTHQCLETIIFGEYGTLEFAISKSNTTDIGNTIKSIVENEFNIYCSNNVNSSNDNNENKENYKKKLSIDSNEQNNLKINENTENIQIQPKESSIINNKTTSKSKNSKRKSSKSYKFGKQQNNLSLSRESEIIRELIGNQCKSDNYEKKRSYSVREEPNYQLIDKHQDLKQKFLQKLNLKSVGNSVYGSQRTIQVNISNQEDCKSVEDQKSSKIGDIKKFSYLNGVQNSFNKQEFDKHNLQEFCLEEGHIQINEYSNNKKKIELNQYLPQNQEKSIIQYLCETPKGYFDQFFKKQTTPLSYENNQSQSTDKKDTKEQDRDELIVSIINHESQQDGEIINKVEGIMNQCQQKQDQENILKRNLYQTSQANIQQNIMQNINNLIDYKQTKNSQTPKHKKSSFSSDLDNTSLNGMFLPYKEDDEQNIYIDQAEHLKIIHSNFPQKIKTIFLKQKPLTNSQVYSSLLQRASVSSSPDISQIYSNKKGYSLNTSQTDLCQQKRIQTKISKFSKPLNKDTQSQTENNNQGNLNIPSRIQISRPNSTNYYSRKSKANYVKQQMDTEELLLPWNDNTYVILKINQSATDISYQVT